MREDNSGGQRNQQERDRDGLRGNRDVQRRAPGGHDDAWMQRYEERASGSHRDAWPSRGDNHAPDRDTGADWMRAGQQSDERWQEFEGRDANGSGRMRAGEYGYGGPGAASERGRGNARSVSHYGKGPKGYSRSDDRIREDVSEALSSDHDVDASEIEIDVAQGEVTLSGTVSTREEKRRAEACVEQCPGVRDVQNRLRVQGDGSGRAARVVTDTPDRPGTAGSAADGPGEPRSRARPATAARVGG